MLVFPEKFSHQLLEPPKFLIPAKTIPKKEEIIIKINIQKTNRSLDSAIKDYISSTIPEKEQNLKTKFLKEFLKVKREFVEKEKMNRTMLTNYRRKEKYNYMFTHSFLSKLHFEKYFDIFLTLDIPNNENPLFEIYNETTNIEDRLSFAEKISIYCDEKINGSEI